MSDQQWYPPGNWDVDGWTRSGDGSPVTPDGSFTAPWWKRLIAVFIDNALISAMTFVVDLQSTSSRAVYDVRMLAELALVFCYFGYLNGVLGQTIGKRLMGTRCVDAETGGAIGFRRGLARYAVVFGLALAFFVPAFVDGLWPLWDRRRQSWHDKAVRSIVINAR